MIFRNVNGKSKVFCSTDDELSSSTGYHNALPLEVHGAGYNQMAMVSNTKALKLVFF